jgi:glycerol-3-phosphate acyltransferase PlsY
MELIGVLNAMPAWLALLMAVPLLVVLLYSTIVGVQLLVRRY